MNMAPPQFLYTTQRFVQSKLGQFDHELSHYPALRTMELQSGIPKVYSVAGMILLYFLLVFINIGGIGELLVNIAALVIPLYHSLVALETRTTADDTHYLTYWVVYASFSIVEFWSKLLLYYFPFYWVFKLIFFMYIGSPNYNGSRSIYLHILRPFAYNVLGIQSSMPGAASASLREKIAMADARSMASGVSFHG